MFSVVVPTYNRASTLSQCLDSVRDQVWTDWECIVVDDGSTDATAELVQAYVSADSRFRYVYQTNGGSAAARNTAIREARREWIAFLDSDDYYFSFALQLFVDVIAREKGEIVCADVADQSPKPPLSSRVSVTVHPAGFWLMDFVSSKPPLLMCCSGIRRELVERIGAFSATHEAIEDAEFWVRATSVADVLQIHYPIACYQRDASPSKFDRIVRDSLNIQATRLLVQDNYLKFLESLGSVGLTSNPDAARICGVYRALLESATSLKHGEAGLAADHFLVPARLLRGPVEITACLIAYKTYLYHPYSDPSLAARRYGGMLRQLIRAISDREPEVQWHLKRSLSDNYFRACQVLRQRGLKGQALGLGLEGLWWAPSVRSLRSFVRLIMDTVRHFLPRSLN